MKKNRKTVVLSAITSDIGLALAKRYAGEGWTIVGTYRSNKLLNELRPLTDHLYYCDLADKHSINNFIAKFRDLNLNWDLFISCAGTQKPIMPFFECNYDEWADSIHVNALEQLRTLHGIYPFRNKNEIPSVVFFAGPGTNKAVLNYSAYSISKIILMKMCELIDFENKDLNIFIIGPGWTKTKIHYETINEKREVIGENYDKTVEFMEHGNGTSMDDIFDCINFFRLQGKKIASGRNFSLIHDKWRPNTNAELINELMSDNDMYKLRRHRNEFKPGTA